MHQLKAGICVGYYTFFVTYKNKRVFILAEPIQHLKSVLLDYTTRVTAVRDSEGAVTVDNPDHTTSSSLKGYCIYTPAYSNNTN